MSLKNCAHCDYGNPVILKKPKQDSEVFLYSVSCDSCKMSTPYFEDLNHSICVWEKRRGDHIITPLVALFVALSKNIELDDPSFWARIHVMKELANVERELERAHYFRRFW